MNNKSVSIADSNILNKTVNLSPDDEQFILNCLNTSDKLHTIFNYFKITEYNFYKIFVEFEVKKNGFISLKCEDESEEFIVLNSLLISYLTSSRTLTDLLESFEQTDLMDDHFKKIYDTNFYYQLMYTLRNFALHGHIPIYFDGLRYSFNLEYILKEGENFKFSNSAKSTLEKVRNTILEDHFDIANIDFYTTITEYHHSLLISTKQFFEVYESILKGKFTKYKELIEKYKNDDDILYLNLGNEIHSIFPNDILKWINSQDNFIQERLSFYEQQFT